MICLEEYLYNSFLTNPEKIACIDENESCTYRELWESATIIANGISSFTNQEEVLPIFMNKSVKALKILWGVLLSGSAYCFIDPMLPKNRILSILNTLESKYILSDENTNKEKILDTCNILLYEELITIGDTNEKEILSRENKPAYVMFTSGTTGEPKGVVVTREAVNSFITEFTEIFSLSSKDVIGNQAPWDFDVSIKDIFSAAKVGACLVIIPKKFFSFPYELVEYIKKNDVTVLIWAVSALCILNSTGLVDKITSLRTVLFSGEEMPIRELKNLADSLPNASFANLYGPTEITCNCTFFKVDKNEICKINSVPIGINFKGCEVFLMDSYNNVIQQKQGGVLGEICVSGSRLAKGYYNNQEESEKRFIQNPTNKKYREIIYKTGDLGCYDENGNLIYKGRKDFQVKINGHRIELAEIESVVNNCNGVKRCICLYEDNKITLVYCGDENLSDTIRHEIRQNLPIFMMPSNIIMMDSLPINSHGKVDRKALKKRINNDSNK